MVGDSLHVLPAFVRVPAGEFAMGSGTGHEDERPVHTVMLDSFELSAHPVTMGQYERFVLESGYRPPAIHEIPLIVATGGRERERTFSMEAAPYSWKERQAPHDRLDHPVTLVRWEDAVAYCAWLSSVLGRPVRLPTEAEWEYAARAGSKSLLPWGEAVEPSRANVLSDATHRSQAGTTPVTRYDPNAFGLYDMIGNVWEWVSDWYAADFYSRSPERNPRGPSRGLLRVVRGGGWTTSDPRMITCAYRHKVPPDTYTYAIGFRVAAAVPS